MTPSSLRIAQEAAAQADAAWPEVIVLAVLQGLTEFLPVSSSGHLTLGRAAFGVEEIGGTLLTVALHVGTLLAVLAVYGKDLVAVLREAVSGSPRELLLILLGSVPAAVVGLGFSDFFHATFERPAVAAACLLVTAVWLVVGDLARRRGEADHVTRVTAVQALAIGCAQAAAIMPGISRSGATIATGLLVGVEARAAARFSFLLSLPAVGGAALVELGDLGGESRGTLMVVLVGMVVAAAVGVLALRLLLVALRKGAFGWFAAYCAALGAAWLLFGPFTLGGSAA